MDGDERRLDGNAAAGMLNEIFPFEMTVAQIHCTGCTAVEPVGAEMVYMDAPGIVMRCRNCDSVLLTIVRAGGRFWLNMPGTVCLKVDES